ncbi:MAG: FAD-dependent oxidoreductase [Actinomycetota bacterium]|nr:FAD-dependent oxidoreductase [Actinomycetota bacterium]
MRSCVVVGAGLSGLTAAQKLQEAGVRVTVLEREDKVGGRMRTELLGGGVFDHGAQFFTVRDDRFEEMVQGWVSAGVAGVWTRGFADASGEKQEDGYPRYKGTDGMTAVAEHVARGLDVRTGSEVTGLDADPRGWKAVAGELTYPADALVLATPVPPALRLIDNNGVSLPAGARRALEGIGYDPCIAVLALLDGPGSVPEPGGVQIGDEPLFWLADNRKKGISEAPAVTIHAGPEFSREHADSDDATAAGLLLEEAKDYVGAEITATAVHRWEYSWVAEPHEEPFVFVEGPPPLVLCGDAYAGPKVEGAALSGLAAAEGLLEAR